MFRIGCMAVSVVAMLLAACATQGVRDLVVGKSSASDVQAVMGRPVYTMARPNSENVLYFFGRPVDRELYAVTIGTDGVVRGIEQTLTRANIARIAIGSSTKEQVRTLLGPPYRAVRAARDARDVWEYPWRETGLRRILRIGFSDDGVAREVVNTRENLPFSRGG